MVFVALCFAAARSEAILRAFAVVLRVLYLGFLAGSLVVCVVGGFDDAAGERPFVVVALVLLAVSSFVVCVVVGVSIAVGVVVSVRLTCSVVDGVLVVVGLVLVVVGRFIFGVTGLGATSRVVLRVL